MPTPRAARPEVSGQLAAQPEVPGKLASWLELEVPWPEVSQQHAADGQEVLAG